MKRYKNEMKWIMVHTYYNHKSMYIIRWSGYFGEVHSRHSNRQEATAVARMLNASQVKPR
jgi:hypothetical protein